MTARLARRIADLEESRTRLLHAYYDKQAIADDIYRSEDHRLMREMALARIELTEAETEQFDIEGALAFAQHLVSDARRLWLEGSLDQRQRLQKVLFPRGVVYSPTTGFGTRETCPLFAWLAAVDAAKPEEASPTGFEPVLPA